MTCLAEERFIELLDGGGLEATQPEERSHLDFCESCRDSWAMASAAAAVIGDARPRRSARFGWLPLGAAAAVLIGIIGVVMFKSPPAASTKPVVSDPILSFIDGTPEESLRARAELVKAGRPILRTLVEARIRNKGSARLGAIRDLIHEIKGAGRPEFSGLDDRKYTFKIKQLSLENALLLFRANAGVNLILDPGLPQAAVDGRVDLDVENGTLRDVLELLCTVTDLDFDFRHGVWFIGSPARLWSTKPGEPVPLENSWQGKPLSPENQRIADQLRSIRVTIDMDNAPFDSVVQYLVEISQLKFVQTPWIPDMDIRLKVENLSLAHVLELLTLPRGLDAHLEGGVVVLFSRGAKK